MLERFQNFANEEFEGTFDSEEVIHLDDDGKEEEVKVQSNRLEGDQDQFLKKAKYYKKAVDGRNLPVDAFIGKSWTGQDVPQDKYGECLNPFERHEARLVYLGVDGGNTEKGNVLCSECFEFNRQRKEYAESFRCLWRLLWNPEVF